MESSRVKCVYNINQRDGRTFWTRIGVAFVNRDGSLNVRLESLPVNGEMHVRDFVPRDDSQPREDHENPPIADPAALGVRPADSLSVNAA